MSLLSRLFRNRKRELDEELQSHLRMAIQDNVARGMEPNAARAAAMREFGSVPLIEDVTRATWGWQWLERISQDLRYALRQIRRSPAFAATVIGTLALGIAAATAMFTVVDHAFLRPLPYRDAKDLVLLWEKAPGSALHERWSIPWLDIQEWMKRNRSFDQISFSSQLTGRNYLEGNTAALEVNGISVTSNLFPMLGVKPALGRVFLRKLLASPRVGMPAPLFSVTPSGKPPLEDKPASSAMSSESTTNPTPSSASCRADFLIPSTTQKSRRCGFRSSSTRPTTCATAQTLRHINP